MLPGLYSAATGLHAAAKQQEVISQNLAHLSVPGYRRSVVALESFEDALQQAAMQGVAPTGLGTRVRTVQYDFSPGAIRNTGRELDLALSGDGFFTLEGIQGPLYTRDGAFRLDTDGQLVHSSGAPVRGGGGPIVIPPDVSVSQIQVTPEGTILAGQLEIGQLELAAFDDNSQLVAAGTAVFAAPRGVATRTPEVTVHQGALELANVDAVNEMVRMIIGSRHYEASQRAIHAIGEAVRQNTDPQQG